MLDWLTGITNEGITLARVVIILVAIISVIITYYKTQALVPVVGAALVAGIAIWAVSPAGITQLENWIGQDTAAGLPDGGGVVLVLDSPNGGGGGAPPLVVAAADLVAAV